jgi:hypothetical protein
MRHCNVAKGWAKKFVERHRMPTLTVRGPETVRFTFGYLARFVCRIV